MPLREWLAQGAEGLAGALRRWEMAGRPAEPTAAGTPGSATPAVAPTEVSAGVPTAEPVAEPVAGNPAEKPAGKKTAARPTEDPAMFRPMVYGDPERLHISPTAIVNNALFNLSSGEITVADYAFFGHNVSVLTGTHDFTKFGAERQVAVPKSGRDVVIEEGVWVSSNAIIVAPYRIGAHSVVGVGALVLKDVEPYSVVAGSPARLLRKIPPPGGAEPEAAAEPELAAPQQAQSESRAEGEETVTAG